MASKNEIEAARAYVLVELRENIDRGVAELRGKLRTVSRELSEYGRSVAKLGLAITASFAGALSSLAAPIKIAANIERTTAEFAALTGSMTEATELISDLRQFAARTPLQFQGLAQETRTLLAFGIPVKQASNDIRVLSEVAGGNQVRLARLALAFGQVAAKGRLMATEVRQFTESGFNPLQEIARTTGISIGELQDRMAEGEISFQQVRKSFVSATSDGGRFEDLLSKMSQTSLGLFTTLKDSIAIAVEPFGAELLPLINDALMSAISLTNRFGQWADKNREVAFTIASIGTAGLVAGASITALGASVLVIGKSMELLNDVALRGIRLLAKLSLVGTSFQSSNAAIRTVRDESMDMQNDVAVSMQQVRLSLSQTGQRFLSMSRTANSAMKATGKIAKTFSTTIQSSFPAALTSVSAFSAGTTAQLGSLNSAIKVTLLHIAELKLALSTLSVPNINVQTISTAATGMQTAVSSSMEVVRQSLNMVGQRFITMNRTAVASMRSASKSAKTFESQIASSFSAALASVSAFASGTATQLAKVNAAIKSTLVHVAELQLAFATLTPPSLEVPAASTATGAEMAKGSVKASKSVAADVAAGVASTADAVAVTAAASALKTADKTKSAVKEALKAEELMPDGSPGRMSFAARLLRDAEQAADAASEYKVADAELRGVNLFTTGLIDQAEGPKQSPTISRIIKDAELAADAASEYKLADAELRGVNLFTNGLIDAAEGPKQSPTIARIIRDAELAADAAAEYKIADAELRGVNLFTTGLIDKAEGPKRSPSIARLIRDAELAADAASEFKIADAELRGVNLFASGLIDAAEGPRSSPFVDRMLRDAEAAADAASELRLAPVKELKKSSMSIEEIALDALGISGSKKESAIAKRTAGMLIDAETAVKSRRPKISKAMTGLGADFAMASADITASLGTNSKALGFVKGAFGNVFGGIGKIVTRTFGIFGNAGRFIMAPFVTALGPVIAYGGAIVAAGAGIALLMHRAGLLVPVFNTIKTAVLNFVNLVSKVFKGVVTAISIGEIGTAFKIVWAGVKVAFIRAVDGFVQAIPHIGSGIITFVWKMGEALVATVVDIAKAIPRLIMAAFSGAQSVSDILIDIVSGNFSDGMLQNVRSRWEADLDDLVSGVQKRQQDIEADNKRQLAEQNQADAKRKQMQADQEARESEAANVSAAIQKRNQEIQSRLASGISRMALGLSSEEIDKANDKAQERIGKLADETRELRYGKTAADQFRLALSGVSAANRVAIRDLEQRKKVLEANKEVRTRIQALRDEAIESRRGADFVERLKLARQGANVAMLKELKVLQQQKAFRELRTQVMDDINSLRFGEAAMEKAKLARQGLNAVQIQEITTLNKMRDAMTEAKGEADRLNEQFKTPLQTFRETQQKIVRLQQAGLISQEVAAKAQTEAIKDIQKEAEKLQGSEHNALFDQESRQAFMQRLRERQAELVAQNRGRQIAARTEKEINNQQIKQSADPKSLTRFEQFQQRTMGQQSALLGKIAKNTAKPTKVVSIR